MTVASLPRLQSNKIDLDLSSERFGWLRSSIDVVEDVGELRQRMARDGYLFLPGLLDRDEVIAARHAVAEKLAAAGHLNPAFPVVDCIAAGDANIAFTPEVAMENAALMKLLYDGAMMKFFARFLGEPVRHYDFTWFRTVAPGRGTPSHCDVVYMGRGETERLFTAWTPIGDVPLDVGGLMILEGSNCNQRLKETYGRSDVDSYCENRPGQRDGWARGNGGFLGKNAGQIQRSVGGRWLTCREYHMGDVLVFSMYTVHASLDNHSNQIRLSSDTRYQPASTPADERWIGANPPAHGSAGKRGRIC